MHLSIILGGSQLNWPSPLIRLASRARWPLELAEGVACLQGDVGIFSSPEDCEHGPDVD